MKVYQKSFEFLSSLCEMQNHFNLNWVGGNVSFIQSLKYSNMSILVSIIKDNIN